MKNFVEADMIRNVDRRSRYKPSVRKEGAMRERTTISLVEEAELALHGAEKRYVLAKQNLSDYLLQYPFAATANDRSWLALEIELDDARRFLAKCRLDLEQLKNERG